MNIVDFLENAHHKQREGTVRYHRTQSWMAPLLAPCPVIFISNTLMCLCAFLVFYYFIFLHYLVHSLLKLSVRHDIKNRKRG